MKNTLKRNIALSLPKKKVPKKLDSSLFNQTFHLLPAFSFRGDKWVAVSTDDDDSADSLIQQTTGECCQSNDSRGELRLITYNIWFDSYYQDARILHLLSILKSQRPHVISLQEVTLESLEFICRDEWIRDEFVLSDSSDSGNVIYPYGTMLLVSKSLLQNCKYWRLSMHNFQSQMNRYAVLLTAQLNNGQWLKVCGVHLESLNFASFRRTQLLDIVENVFTREMDQDDTSISQDDETTKVLMGDFNFDSEVNYSSFLNKSTVFGEKRKAKYDPDEDSLENNLLTDEQGPYAKWIDVWKSLKYHPNKSQNNDSTWGKTFDSVVNTMICATSDGIPENLRLRCDRILLCSNHYRATDIQLLGTQPFQRVDNLNVQDKDSVIFPSDHFGLCTSLHTTI